LTDKRDLPVLFFESSEKWAAWLDTNHDGSAGVWLKIAKRSAAEESVSYADALDVALCYGWIDGQKGKLDDDYWLQRFTPRRPRSKWSKINSTKATALIASGQMKASGLREIEKAKADGRWDAAYEGQRSATVPADLQRELDANKDAREFFERLSSVNRYAILYRIQDAKKPETRQRRIDKYVQMLKERKTIHP
jgi:uncharacterized protein YdeI (YjbR/CyaY-like superfamily)